MDIQPDKVSQLLKEDYALSSKLLIKGLKVQQEPNTEIDTIENQYHQRKVGDCVDDFLTERSKQDFSLYKYIGETAMNSALLVESLVYNK